MSELTKKASKALSLLKQAEIDALLSLYDLKCLTCEQIYQLHYSAHKNSSYCKKRLKLMIENDIIEEVKSALFETCYFLKVTGVNIVKHERCLNATIYDEEKNVITKGYFTAGELKLKDKYINHQLHLNQFYIDFLKSNKDESFIDYKDSKHTQKFSHVIPDGVIDIYDVLFFVEMDMATESKKQLSQKWMNYRDFLRSEECKSLKKKIVVLFVVESRNEKGFVNIENRKKVIEGEAYTILNSEIEDNFDIYIGSKNEILDVFKLKMKPLLNKKYDKHIEIRNIFKEKFNYSIRHCYHEKVKDLFPDMNNIYLARENLPMNLGKNPLYFLIDDAICSSFQSINKICCFNDIRDRVSSVDNEKQFDVYLIMVCDSFDTIFSRLRQFDLVTQKNIYYTTLDRLNEKDNIYESLVVFDNLANVYTFSDRNLSNYIYEETLNSKFIPKR